MMMITEDQILNYKEFRPLWMFYKGVNNNISVVKKKAFYFLFIVFYFLFV